MAARCLTFGAISAPRRMKVGSVVARSGGDPVEFLFRCGIGAGSEELLCFVAPTARFRERRGGVAAENQQLLLAGKMVLEPPQLAAVRLHQQIQAAAI